MPATLLAEITWQEAASFLHGKNAIVLPIAGGTKEHGDHLPLGTDMFVINELVNLIASECRENILFLPILNYAYFPAFTDWPGTVTISAKTFIDFVSDIIRCIAKHGAKKFLILDGGVSTQAPLSIVSYDLANELGVEVAITNISELGGIKRREVCQEKYSGHADESETSCILAIRPDLVHINRAISERSAYFPESKDQNGATLITLKGPMRTRSGINGDPIAAQAWKGKAILDAMALDILNFLRAFLEKE